MRTQLIIFGITGDLSKRKLLPALEKIALAGKLEEVEIIGVSRRTLDIDALLIETFGNNHAKNLRIRPLLSGHTMDMSSDDDYNLLSSKLRLHESDTQIIFYMSLPPQASVSIVEKLGEAGINTPNVKLLLEKPFGVDLVSAQENIARDHKHFSEDQLYRIDHYLAKEMAQNILVFRGSNALLSAVWNNQFIEKIDIVATEKIGIEGRSQFYEQTGALRDVLQGHLMQLAALVLMDIPEHFSWEGSAKQRLNALDDILPVNFGLSDHHVVRGQYEGYEAEVENPGSQTETFVALTLFSENPIWKGVPIQLITGKNLHKKTTEIQIHFKKRRDAQSNTLTLHIQPHEGVELALLAKKSGYEREYENKKLRFDYTEDAQLPDAYEQVLIDAMESDKSLFTSSEEVLRSWEILRPLQEHWSMHTNELIIYKPGSKSETIAP